MIKVTHDELRDYIDKFDAAGMVNEPAVKALRAVVELHKPCDPVSDDKFVTCETCNYEYDREYPWPCETIQAIKKELG